MAYVYRYKDMWTNEIHYVGIVWSKTRKLDTRISEHYKNDKWCTDGCYIVEVLDVPVDTRIDAEYYEAHYISLYDTGRFYNKLKTNLGVSKLIPDNEDKWKYYGISFPMKKEDKNKYDVQYMEIQNKSQLDKFDYFYITVDSEDGYDAVVYKTKKKKSSFENTYKLFAEIIPKTYGVFEIESLETTTDLASKLFLSGKTIKEIIEDKIEYCDRFGDELLSCCLSLGEKEKGAKYTTVAEIFKKN